MNECECIIRIETKGPSLVCGKQRARLDYPAPPLHWLLLLENGEPLDVSNR